MKQFVNFFAFVMKKVTYLLATTLLFQTFFLNAQTSCNLVTNGDFEAGNTGFTSQLTLNCNSNNCSTGAYCVTTNFKLKCSSWPNFSDHTPTGVGNFLAIDGSTSAAKDVWSTPITVAIGTPYTFSFWYASIYPSTSQSFDLGMIVNGKLVNTINVSQTTPNVLKWVQYTFSGTTTMNISTIAIRQLTPGAFRDFGLDDIVFSACPPPTPKYCCPGDNLIKNGTFNAGNVEFTSNGYQYKPLISNTTIIMPGEYSVVTGNNPGGPWAVTAPTCSPVDPFLIVNGNTTGTPKLAWRTTLPVKEWGKYKFCFNVKNLGDGKLPPQIEIKFPNTSLGSSTETINATAGPCNWKTISRAVDLWGTPTSLTIEIWLNESPNTAPNDLAFDNIALIEVPQCPVASAMFSITTNNLPSYYEITAKADVTGPCTATWWEVCEVSAMNMTCSGNVVTNPKIWWIPTLSFNGYPSGPFAPSNPTITTPGKFEYGKLYKITRGTWGDCYGWNAFTMYVASSVTLRRPKFFTEQDIKANKSLIQEAMK